MTSSIVSDPPRWARGLNEMQRKAVDHEGGPLLIVAGAGTGKTRTLVSRLARLLEDGVAPERILLVTFSRRAAAEMIRRAGQIADPASARRVEAGTFHSVAHRVLRRYRAALGLAEGFSVLDPGDVRDLIGLVRAPVAASVGRRFPRTETVTAIYSRVVSSQVTTRGHCAARLPLVRGRPRRFEHDLFGLHGTEAGPTPPGLRGPAAALACRGSRS